MPVKLTWKMVWELIVLPVRLITSGGGALIYYPRSYAEIPEYAEWLKTVERFEYLSEGKMQTAFLDVDPECSPERIWLFFGGNGALALDWLPITSFAPPSSDAFVLVDYPGYGFSKGIPSPSSIEESVNNLIETLMKKFDLSGEELRSRLGVVGHSLGSAIAMHTAARYRLGKVILVSPFTTMKAMAAMTVGPFIARFLRHHYDNFSSIRDWNVHRESNEHILIFHGTDDEIIPVSMSNELSTTFPDSVRLEEFPGGDHNEILLILRDQLLNHIVHRNRI